MSEKKEFSPKNEQKKKGKERRSILGGSEVEEGGNGVDGFRVVSCFLYFLEPLVERWMSEECFVELKERSKCLSRFFSEEFGGHQV